MKRRTFTLIGALFASSLACAAIGCIAFHNEKEATEAHAYSTSSLPTTIDLNDTEEANVRSYYSSLNALPTSERQGTNLLKNLKPILKTGQKYYSYDSGAAIWNAYAIVDRDWVHSPASEITSGTYNANTNKIIGYSYGESYDNPYLHALYYNRDRESIAQAFGDHGNNTSTGINREHIWPKGAGFDTEGSGGARGDLMHLWAAHGHTNNIHSNNFYGYVDTTKKYTDVGNNDTYAMCAGNLKGYSKTMKSGTVFEPQDDDKGDIARACFYMVARYNYLSGSDSDGIDTNNPNLELVNNVSDYSSGGYTSSTTKTGKLGILQDLLEWNRLDPPDEFEIHRNNLLYTNFTNSRNPFIDYPEWAEYIWGKSEEGTYNSSSTGYATPSDDSLNAFSGSGPTWTIRLSNSSKTMKDGDMTTLTATSVDSSQISWSTSNSGVASISASTSSSGTPITITAVSAGFATITASVTIDEMVHTKTCGVTVTSSSQGEYTIGWGTATGEEGTYSNFAATSGSVDGILSFACEKNNASAPAYIESSKQLRLYYDTSNNGNGCSLTLTPADDIVITKAVITAVPDSQCPSLGYSVDSGAQTVITATDDIYTISGIDASSSLVIQNVHTAGNTQLRIKTIDITYLTAKRLDSIYLDTSDTQTEFDVGATFNYDNLQVIASYDNGAEENVTPTSVSSPNMSTPGNKTITVTYTEKGVTKTATYEITVRYVLSATVSKTYYVGETISISDISVKDGQNADVLGFTFDDDGYRFTFEDAESGGELTNKVFASSIHYAGFACDLTVQVRRKAFDMIVSDTLTQSTTGITGTGYTAFSGKTVSSSAVYAGQCAGSNSSIQLRSTAKDGNYSGIIATSSGGILSKVTVVWNDNTANGRTLNIYGKNAAYSSANDLHDGNDNIKGTLLGTIVKGTSTTLFVTDSYQYVGVTSNNGAMYLSSITFTYGTLSAENIANYIMNEDTENQCTTKFDLASGYFEELSKAERASFMTSDNYVVSSARTRFEAWAAYHGKTISYENNDYIVKNSKSSSLIETHESNEKSWAMIIVVAIAALVSAGVYFTIKRRKYE